MVPAEHMYLAYLFLYAFFHIKTYKAFSPFIDYLILSYTFAERKAPSRVVLRRTPSRYIMHIGTNLLFSLTLLFYMVIKELAIGVEYAGTSCISAA